jgi:hypothetical protein
LLFKRRELPYVCSLNVSAAARKSSNVENSGNKNAYKFAVNVSGFESVCKAKQRECLEAAVQTKV